MKYKTSLITAAFLFFGMLSFAQQKTALHHNGATTIFSGSAQFTNAYNAAVDGDTIYLPGGIFTTFPTLNKGLVIYGTGVHPDSTAATGETTISGNLTINGGADNLQLHGLDVTGSINFSNNNKVDSVTINRYLMMDLNVIGAFSTPCTDLLVKECIVLGSVYFSNATQSTLTNSLVTSTVNNGSLNAFQNNIFFKNPSGSAVIYGADNSLFANNVFLSTSTNIFSGTEFSTFANNVFAVTVAPGSNTFTGNYMNTPMATFFVNQTGYTPDFYHDYHLTAPTSFFGLDGTVVGLFGGLYPFKLGDLPENPHIISKTIATQTGTNGDLNIQVQVSAQDQ